MLVCMEAQAARWMFHGGSPLQRERDTCRFAWCPCRFAWREQEVPTKDVAQIASCPVLWSQTFFAFHRRGVNLCCFDQWLSNKSCSPQKDNVLGQRKASVLSQYSGQRPAWTRRCLWSSSCQAGEAACPFLVTHLHSKSVYYTRGVWWGLFCVVEVCLSRIQIYYFEVLWQLCKFFDQSDATLYTARCKAMKQVVSILLNHTQTTTIMFWNSHTHMPLVQRLVWWKCAFALANWTYIWWIWHDIYIYICIRTAPPLA